MGTARHNPTTVTPASIIAEAEEQVREADKLAADLEAAARNGDEAVGIDQLQEAQQRASWARIRRDAAAKKAEQRAEELRKEQYSNLLANYLEAATSDVAAEISAELEQARPHIERALDLLIDRNRAVWAITEYAGHAVNYTDPADALESRFFPNVPGASWFTFRGKRYEFVPATSVVKLLLAPLKTRLRDQSGGVAGDWIKEI